ncbi:MAG: threonine/serine dehydratase [Alphaproteobacteria bacterium]|nr:threonine/serine dehydratase [Alphaproteobacteria bacterium]
MPIDPPSIAEIEAAAKRLAGHVVRTPLVESPSLNERLGGRLLVKAEVLQRTGSFKFRGAYNRISQLDAGQRGRGVVAFSSGNHAQGVALAAKLAGVPAVIVMPKDAPAIKIANTRGYGAEVVLYDRYTEDREGIGRKVATERGAVLVPPYDDPYIIAGQGTCGLEIVEQCAGLGLTPDAVLAPASGGGLVAGVATAVKAKLPGTAVYAVEPATMNDTARSLAEGRRVANDPAARSICDALMTAIPGELTFSVNRRLLAGALAVSDQQVMRAMRGAFEWLKLVIEPGGSVAFAAALEGLCPVKGRVVVAVASGGNVDPETYRQALAA